MNVLLAAAAFVAMEPIAAVAHRLVMHRAGYRWHRSHHAPAGRAFERNDLFPVVFGCATVGLMALGSWVAALGFLVPVGAGITAYGLAYFLVHDVAVHGRGAGRPLGMNGYVRRVRAAHRVHHLAGGAPYGFLLPVGAPRSGTTEGTHAGRDASGRPIAAAAATRSLRAVPTDARPEKTS
jgi:beta-carotene 3-hydroxylase